MLALTVALHLAVASQAVARPDFVHPGGACETCHMGRDARDRGWLVDSGRDQESLCGACHEGAVEASHPSGFRPDRALPAGFPLDATGAMTCSTCHDLSRPTRGALRVSDSGREFCRNCHRPAFFEAMADKGASIQASGHLEARPGLAFEDIDRYSRKCVACHEDRASVVSGGSRSRAVALSEYGSRDHSIGPRYVDAIGFGGYRPRAMVAQEVMLPDGRVGCVSCHAGYAREHGRLVRPRAQMCSPCHDL